MKNILNLALVLALTAGASNGEITVDATSTFVTPVTTYTSSQTFDASSFDPSGSDKLVAVISGRGGSFLEAPTVTFNGQTMNHIVTRAVPGLNTHRGVSSLFYIDAPGTGGNLVLTYNTQIQDVGIALLALSGTATGFTGATIESNSSLSGTISTSVDGSLVIAGAWYGDDFTAPIEVSLSVNSPLTGVLSTQIDMTNPVSAVAAGYYLDPDAGDVAISFTGSNGTPVSNFVAAAFAPSGIPAPSPLAVAGFVYNPGANTFDLSLKGAASSAYILVEAADLDFGTPDQSPIPLDGATATVGSLDTVNDTITTDGSGNASVTGVSLGAGAAKDATFLRAETAP